MEIWHGCLVKIDFYDFNLNFLYVWVSRTDYAYGSLTVPAYLNAGSILLWAIAEPRVGVGPDGEAG